LGVPPIDSLNKKGLEFPNEPSSASAASPESCILWE